jgi:hypothetical protein
MIKNDKNSLQITESFQIDSEENPTDRDIFNN